MCSSLTLGSAHLSLTYLSRMCAPSAASDESSVGATKSSGSRCKYLSRALALPPSSSALTIAGSHLSYTTDLIREVEAPRERCTPAQRTQTTTLRLSDAHAPFTSSMSTPQSAHCWLARIRTNAVSSAALRSASASSAATTEIFCSPFSRSLVAEMLSLISFSVASRSEYAEATCARSPSTWSATNPAAPPSAPPTTTPAMPEGLKRTEPAIAPLSASVSSGTSAP
mmetsp:Transcript_2423/g.5638  ORF Transcript_2423/g.5638 Transcript_2423/m.5638 type:complete len:226 (-) Transcript_2423:9-686(-)